MTVVKVTKRDNFNKLMAIEAVAADEELVAFIQHEIDLLDKKSASKKSAKNSDANKAFVENVKAILQGSEGMTITEILMAGVKQGLFNENVSNQKIRTIVGFMIEDGVAIRKVKGKKALFSLV